LQSGNTAYLTRSECFSNPAIIGTCTQPTGPSVNSFTSVNFNPCVGVFVACRGQQNLYWGPASNLSCLPECPNGAATQTVPYDVGSMQCCVKKGPGQFIPGVGFIAGSEPIISGALVPGNPGTCPDGYIPYR
jgi:hypothetical protein